MERPASHSTYIVLWATITESVQGYAVQLGKMVTMLEILKIVLPKMFSIFLWKKETFYWMTMPIE